MNRYCLGAWQAQRLGSGSVALRRRSDGMVRVVPRRMAPLLASSTRMKELGESDSATERLLLEWVSHGILVSETDFRAECAHDPERDGGEIEALVVVTANRPASLAKCVASHLASEAFGSGRQLLVFDDSRLERTRDANLAALEELRSSHGARIRYAGVAEKQRFASVLASKSGLSRELVEFAFWGTGAIERTLGGNRNAALLETAGHKLLFVDDDTTARVAPHASGSGLSMARATHPVGEFWFHDDLARAARAERWVEHADVCSQHQLLLGKSSRQIVADWPAREPLLGDWGGDAMHAVLSGEARVLGTQMGVVGDTGADSAFGCLLLDGESRQRLVRTEADYTRGITSRVARRRVRQPTLSDTGFCMAHVLGLDNRQPLPPFLPIGRNSDGVFGFSLRRSHPNAHLGYLPHAVWHSPPEARAWHPHDVWRGPSVWRIPEIVSAVLASVSLPSTCADSNERLQALGRGLVGSSQLSADDLDAVLFVQWSRRMQLLLGELERRLAEYGSRPAWWARDVERAIRLVHELLSAGRLPRPRDLPSEFLHDGGHHALQQLLAGFGALFCHWQELTRCARELRAMGTRMTVRI